MGCSNWTMGILLVSTMGGGSLAAQDGIVFQAEVSGPEGETSGRQTLYVAMDRLRAEGTAQMGVVIFRQDLQVMWAIDPAEKTYTELNEAQVEAMGQQIAQAREETAKQMADLPPEQRAMMEKMLERMGGQKEVLSEKPSEEWKLEKVSSGHRVGSYTCDRYAQYLGQSKEQELCLTDWNSLGIKPTDLAVFSGFLEFTRKLTEAVSAGSGVNLGDRLYGPRTDPTKLPGFPVQSINYGQSGQVEATFILTAVDRQKLDPDLFEIPDDYRKVTPSAERR